MITIIDVGMANLGSITNMINRLGFKSEISNDISKIKLAKSIILPGVGSFDRAICNLKNLHLIEPLKKKILLDKIPILGICLGMQLLTKKSEEGKEEGLNIIDAKVVKFNFTDITNLKIPHMGWNLVEQKKKHILFDDMFQNPRFYFAHSYHVICNEKENIITTTNYGYDFVSSFAKENVMGVQFHPEKSHKYGMKLLKNFTENF
ncbi:MAG: imidazole glycerol phosphate synthase subunit HisH [Ignavibacteriota bacterium]|jgi:glutamine amidotransferase|nr:imidazole glycerol phosphate synthase subunit HisH [Ignavibacteriota bacterium]QKJ98995.1 MAG: imidazole glycerol phosphate synthase subunit HisH [Ignavibacteriota bacterium]